MNAESVVPKIAAGAALLGATGGVVGAFAVLRRRSLLGDTLAHAALPGICIAHLLLATRDLWALSVGALLAGLLGVVCVTAIPKWTRTREDAALGLVLSTFFGVGVVLLSIAQQRPTGAQAGLDSFLFGEVAALRGRDVRVLAVVAAVSLAATAVFFKELKLLCFDEGFAAAQGWPTYTLDLAVMSGVALVTIVCLPVCGVVLMAAVLIFPCVTARYWSNRLGVVLLLSAVLGAAAAALGVLSDQIEAALFTASPGGLPPGPMIVLVSGLFFAASLLAAPERGLIARGVQTLRTRVEVVTDHVLREMYEFGEETGGQANIPGRQLAARVSSDPLTLRLVLALMRWRGWLEADAGGTLRLTPSGGTEAAGVTRTHRLWEIFLVSRADIAADHAHRPADELEHFLPRTLVAELEAELARTGRLPQPAAATAAGHVPPSLHAPATTEDRA
ncbi:MAG: iron chelate uptake ABC transporter family permease subunit [Planctomycetota bacterium]